MLTLDAPTGSADAALDIPALAQERGWKPQGSWLYVKLLQAEERLASGLILPQRLQENWTDAWVIAVGPGREHHVQLPESDGGSMISRRETLGIRQQDRVLFQKRSLFCPEGLPEGEGFVDAADVVALLQFPTYRHWLPMNDWVQLVPDRMQESTLGSGILAAPEIAQRRSLSGRVYDVGAGRMFRGGPLAGLRVDSYDLMCRRAALIGRRVHWDPRAEFVETEGEDGGVEHVYLRALDLIAITDEPADCKLAKEQA